MSKRRYPIELKPLLYRLSNKVTRQKLSDIIEALALPGEGKRKGYLLNEVYYGISNHSITMSELKEIIDAC